MNVVKLLLIFSLFLAACAPPQPADTPPAVPATPTNAENGQESTPESDTESDTDNSTETDSAASLADSQWVLVSFGAPGAETPVAGATPITLEFTGDTQVGGNGGCNSYGGSYQVEGNTLLLSEIASTLMACADSTLMDQETQYLSALQMAGEFEVAGDSLTVAYDGGVLNFTRAGAGSSSGSEQPVETPAAEDSTPQEPAEGDATPTPEEAAQPQTTGESQSFVWNCYGCTGNQVWLFENGQAGRVEIPVELGTFLDYSPATGRILYTTPQPALGAGPAQMGVSDLWLLDMASGQAMPIFSEQTVVEAEWAPDGEHLAYVLATDKGYELHWRGLNGEDKLLAPDVAFTFSVSPQGDKVAFTRESNYASVGTPGLYVVDVATGEESLLSDVDRAGAGSIEDKPAWSPSGQHVMLPTYGTTGGPGLLRAAVDGSNAVTLTFDPALSGEEWFESEPFNPVWIEDNQFIATAGLNGADAMLGGDSGLILYQLNDTLDTIVAGTPIVEFGNLIGWDVAGSSVWVQVGTEMQSIPLPVL